MEVLERFEVAVEVEVCDEAHVKGSLRLRRGEGSGEVLVFCEDVNRGAITKSRRNGWVNGLYWIEFGGRM